MTEQRRGGSAGRQGEQRREAARGRQREGGSAGKQREGGSAGKQRREGAPGSSAREGGRHSTPKTQVCGIPFVSNPLNPVVNR